MNSVKWSLLLLLFNSCLLGIAQEAPTHFTTYYGRVVQVGDTPWMGIPTPKDYSSSVLLNKANKQSKFLRADLSRWHKQPLVVTEIPSPRRLKNDTYGDTYVTVKCKAPDQSTTLLIDLDQAVYDNIIQMYRPYDMSHRNSCIELTPARRLAYYLLTKQLELNDDNILEYIQLTDPKKGEQCAYDKFEFRRVRDQYSVQLQRDVQTLQQQMEDQAIFYTKVTDKRPINMSYEPAIGGYQYTKINDCNNTKSKGYDDYNTWFMYQPCETILKMLEPEAERYERKLKGNRNNPYHNETLVFYMNLMPYQEGYYSSKYVCALLKTVEVFDDPSGEVNYLGEAEYAPDHYEKVQKQLKREKRSKTIGAVVGGVLGILGLF